MNCAKCGKSILTEGQVSQEFAKLGIDYQPGGTHGNPYGVSQGTFDSIESRKGFRCRACGDVFCMDCIKRYAPQHPQGGRACLSCGGQYGRYT